MKSYPFLIPHEDGILIKLFVQPRSSKNRIAGIHGDALKLHLTSPPVDGKANKMCIDFLAKILAAPKSSLEIISGQTSRNKVIRFKGQKDMQPESPLRYLEHKLDAFINEV